MAFVELAMQFPEIAPVLQQLTDDHQVIAHILEKLEQVVANIDPSTPERASRELDGLAAILESHFAWEEKRLVDALDHLHRTRTSEDLLGVDPVS